MSDKSTRYLNSRDRQQPGRGSDPGLSPVLQVKAAEITPSEHYAAGLSLRFPRVELIRRDKGSGEATSRAELESLWAAGGKLTGGRQLVGGQGGPPSKRPRVGVAAVYRGQDLELERVDSHCLQGRTVVVEPPHPRHVQTKPSMAVKWHKMCSAARPTST